MTFYQSIDGYNLSNRGYKKINLKVMLYSYKAFHFLVKGFLEIVH